MTYTCFPCFRTAKSRPLLLYGCSPGMLDVCGEGLEEARRAVGLGSSWVATAGEGRAAALTERTKGARTGYQVPQEAAGTAQAGGPRPGGRVTNSTITCLGEASTTSPRPSKAGRAVTGHTLPVQYPVPVRRIGSCTGTGTLCRVHYQRCTGAGAEDVVRVTNTTPPANRQVAASQRPATSATGHRSPSAPSQPRDRLAGRAVGRDQARA